MLNTQKTIIIIDSTTNPTDAKNALIEKHDVFFASSEEELFSILEKVTPDLILLDIDTPGVDGYNVIKILKSNVNTADIPILLLSTMCDSGGGVKGLSLGASDYVFKPFSKELLISRVDMHLLLQQQAKEIRKYNGNLETLITEKAKTVSALQKAVSKAADELASAHGQVAGGHVQRMQSCLLLLVRALIREGVYAEEFAAWESSLAGMSMPPNDTSKISKNDDSLANPYKLSTQLNTIIKTVTSVVDVSDERFDTDSMDKMMQHLQNFINIMSKTGNYVDEIADWDIDLLLVSAQLHDIGISAISGDILNKAESLTDAEFESVKNHVGVGVDMIRKISENIGDKEVLRYAEAIAATHHEKWDGTGYPNGLKGEEIPLQGRVMSLIDTYDALTSNRPHREKIAHDKAVNVIKKLGGTHFDPQLVSLFAANEHIFDRSNMK